MSEVPITELQLTTIFEQLIARNKIVTIEQCQAVWQCFVKTVASYADPKKSVLVSDMFYISNRNVRNFNMYSWSPTTTLLQKCGLKYENQIPSLEMTIVLTKQKMSRNIIKQDCLKALGDEQQGGWQIFEEILKQIKMELTNFDNFEINLEFFGILRVENRVLQHFEKQDKNVRIKTLMTPKKKTSHLRISRRQSQLGSLSKQSSSQNLSQEEQSIMSQKQAKQRKKSKLLNPLTRSVGMLNMQKTQYMSIGNKQKSFNYNFASPDTKISNDLLGAGIDPLKFDYNYSNLVNETDKLFGKTFSRPKPAKIRHPGIIDKFERTSGVPQTGLKVSNSVIVRIGSNYNNHAKFIYSDIKSKGIQFVPQQPKIALGHTLKAQKLRPICATEQQQLNYICTNNPNLQSKVQNRIHDFKRYKRYISQFIQNSNVCPMAKTTIKRIVDMVSSTMKGQIKDQVSIEIMDKSINQANQMYYYAYKKSILDYILKDQKEKERTGVYTIFKPPIEWGQRKINYQSPLYLCKTDKVLRQKAARLLDDHLYYPKCVLQISQLNLKIKELDLFRIKSLDGKPVNVLYFIKRQNTHIADTISYLSSDWIKQASDIAFKYISVQTQDDWKLNTFFKLINVMLSNSLKNVIYQSFNKLMQFFKRFTKQSNSFQSPILQISIMDEGGKFLYSDDFEKIMIQEVQNLVKNIVDESKKIHGIQFYLKDESNSFLWSKMQQTDQQNDKLFYQDVISEIVSIIKQNSKQLNEYLNNFQKYTDILKFQDQISQWLKINRTVEEIQQKNSQILLLEKRIEQIPYCHSTKMVLIQLFDQRQKMRLYLDNIKGPIYQNLCNSVIKGQSKCLKQVQQIKTKISAPIQNTIDYLNVFNDLQQIKRKKLNQVNCEMQKTNKALLKLHTMDQGFVYSDIIYKVYKTNQVFRSLSSKIDYHEDRLTRQKIQLQNNLKQKIRFFQSTTISQLASISSRINQFQLRRVYNDYLIQMNNFKKIVQENQITIIDLNKQQDNLKWNKSVFKAAEELKNIVIPNHQLWNLVLEYDSLMKQWKNKEICHMDVALVKRRVQDINFRVSRNIKKLKNLSSLKVAYQLQKDAKDILTQQVQIIQVFSHPGLKERHWQLFNTKLMIPGIDLKEIPYSKIKIFEEYEKNIKVLAVISSQAAKQYEIQNERNDQQQYWSSVSFDSYANKIENSFSFSQSFLSTCLGTLQQHSSKLSVMKNYLYSKALYQQLQDWQIWLTSCKKNLQNFKFIQEQLKILRPLFSYDQIGKQLPVQVSQFESIDNSWKNLMKKAWEHAKLAEFMKNPKISQMTEEISKKIQLVKRGIQSFLMTVRSQFPRFYFVKQSDLIDVMVKAAYAITEKQGISKSFSLCFAPSLELVQNDDKFLSLTSQTDSLTLSSQIYQTKSKKKLCENLISLQKCMRQSIRGQVLQLSHVNFFHDINKYVNKYCMTSIFCYQNIHFYTQLQQTIKQNTYDTLLIKKRQKIQKIIQILKIQQNKNKQENQKYKNFYKKIIKLSKIIICLIGQIEKINLFKYYQYPNINNFQYLSQLKFQVKSAEENKQTEKNDKNNQKTQTQTHKRQSSRLRRSSIKQGSIFSNFKIEIITFGKTLEFQQEFYGDETHNYLPTFTHKTLFNLVNSVISGYSNSLFLGQGKILVRKLAIFCGKNMAEIIDGSFNQQEEFRSILLGITSSNSWVLFDCNELKLSFKNWQKFDSLIAQLQKIKYGSEELKNSIKQNKNIPSIYLKSLGQVSTPTFRSASFFSFPTEQKLKQIPQSFRTQMRTISLFVPDLSEYIKSDSISQLINISNKSQSKFLKNSLLEMTSLYLKPEKVKYLNKTIFKLMEQKQTIVDQKEKLQSQRETLLTQFENKANGKIFQSVHGEIQTSNQNLTNALNSRKNSKQVPIHHPSFSKQKITYKQFLAKSKEQLTQQINTHKIVLIYGSLDAKSGLVSEVIGEMPGYSKIERSLYSFPAFAFQTSSLDVFVEKTVRNLVHQLRKVFLNKAFPKQIRQGKKQIYLHIQYSSKIEEQFIKCISEAAEKLQNSGLFLQQSQQNEQVSIKLLFDCFSLGNISPSTAFTIGKINLEVPENLNLTQFYEQWIIQNIKIDKQRSYDSRVEYEVVMHNLKTMQPILDHILTMSLKALSAKIGKSSIQQKYILTLRFLRMFKIYIDHLDDKEIDQYIDFDVNSYIKNSFVYCVYWTVCVGFLQPHEHFIVEQLLLKDYFPDLTEIQEIYKYMLNEQNEWLSWSSLKQEFALSDLKNTPIYNVWVSTDENMKIYTNVIKFLEKGLKIVVTGQKSSGKSVLLREISNFEMTYTSFLIDCHRFTNAHQVGEVIKNRVFYTKADKKLILIDDLSLPNDQQPIGQIMKKILDENILTCKFQHNKKVYFNKNLTSSVSALITYNQEDLHQDNGTFSAMDLLQTQLQRLNMRTYQETDLSSIYGSYINFELNKLKLKIGEKSVDFDSLFKGVICKIYKKFHLDLHSINKILRLFLTQLTNLAKIRTEKKQDQIEQKRIVPVQQIVISLNSAIFKVLSYLSNFDSIYALCFDETSKILGSNTIKNVEEFHQKIDLHRYNSLHYSLPYTKAQSLQNLINKTDKTLKEKSQSIGNFIEELVIEKDQGIKFISTSTQVSFITKVISLLRVSPSHIIMLSQLCGQGHHSYQEGKWMQPHGFGVRTLTKVVAMLLSINFTEVENETLNTFINDSLNVIKVGGKIDESVCYLARNQLKKLEKSDGTPSDLISLINSFISSSQLFQFFTEQRIQHIFVKFSSQKKTLKRSEFIRKVREKINQLFHFVLSVDNDGLSYLRKNYPNLVKQCNIIPIFKYPQQALYQIATKVIKSQVINSKKIINLSNNITMQTSSLTLHPSVTSATTITNKQTTTLTLQQEKYKKSICNSLVQIFNKLQSFLKNMYKQQKSSYFVKYKMNNIFDYFETFKYLKKKYEDIAIKQQADNSSTTWQTRRKQTQKKYAQLQQQKSNLQNNTKQQQIQKQIYNIKLQQQTNLLNKLQQQIKSFYIQKYKIIQSINLSTSLFTSYTQNHIQNIINNQILSNLQNQMLNLQHTNLVQILKNTNIYHIINKYTNNINNNNNNTPNNNIINHLKQLQLPKTNINILQLQQIYNNKNNNNNNIILQYFKQYQQYYQSLNIQNHQEIENYYKSFNLLEEKINKLYHQINNVQNNINQIQTQFNNNTNKSTNNSHNNSSNNNPNNPPNNKKQSLQTITKSISQLQPIINIFKHFQKVQQNKNKSILKQNISLNKIYGSLILATAYIQFSFYIGNHHNNHLFYKQCKDVIKSNQLDFDQDKIFDLLLSPQEKFKNKYQVAGSSDALTLCQIGISCNICSVIRVSDDKIISMYQWLEIYTEKTIKIVQNNEFALLNQCILNGNIAIVVNPSLMMLKKMRPLIVNDFQIKNNSMYVNITEQILLNQSTRIIFAFTDSYLQSSGILECGELDGLWHLLYPSVQLQTKLQKEQYQVNKIKDTLFRNRTKRNSLVSDYIELQHEIKNIDRRIQKLIMGINKSHENVDNTIMKISSIGEEKDKTIQKMANILEELKILDLNDKKNNKTHKYDNQEFDKNQREIQNVSKNIQSQPIFTSFQKYLSLVVHRNDSNPQILKEQTNFFINLFIPKHKQFPQETRAKKNSAIQMQKSKNWEIIESIMSKQVLNNQQKYEQLSNLWYQFISTVFGIKDKQAEDLRSSMQLKKQTQTEKTNAHKNIIIYKTNYIQLICKFMTQVLTIKQQQVIEKQVTSLNDYHMGNASLTAIIGVTKLKSPKQWRLITQYVNSDEERSRISKFNNQKLIIICPCSEKIPTFIQQKCFVVESYRQVSQLTYILSKIKNVDGSKLQIIEQVFEKMKEFMQTNSIEINEYQIIDQIISQFSENFNYALSEKSKYLETTFIPTAQQ